MCGEDKVWVSTVQTKKKKIEEMYVLKAHGVAECVHRIKGIKGKRQG